MSLVRIASPSKANESSRSGEEASAAQSNSVESSVRQMDAGYDASEPLGCQS